MLNTKQRLPLYFLAFILTFLIYCLFFSPKFLQVDNTLILENPVQAQLEKWVEQKSQPVINDYAKNLEKLKGDKTRQKITENQETEIKLARFSFQTLHNLRTHINKDQIRKQILDELLQNPAVLQLAIPILTDAEFRRKNFAEDQALARVYAINLLRQVADEGDREPLEQATQKLSSKLSTQEQVSPGEWRDLEDLIIHVIEVRNPQTVAQNMAELLSDLSYSVKAKEAFENAIYFAFRNILGLKEMDKLLP